MAPTPRRDARATDGRRYRIDWTGSIGTAGCIGGRLTRVTNHSLLPDAAPQHHPPPPNEPVQPRDPVQRWRLVLARAALGPDEAQRSQQAAWEAAFADSGLPVAGLDGPRARPRFAAAAPLAATIPGEAELLDVWLTDRLPRWRVREALANGLPTGHSLVDVYDVWLGEAPLPGRVKASVYRAVLGAAVDIEVVRAAAEALCAMTSLPRERRKGESSVTYDLRPFVEAIEVGDAPDLTDLAGVVGAAEPGIAPAILRMILRHDPGTGVGRPDELIAALEEQAGLPLGVRDLVRERLLLAAPPVGEKSPRSAGQRSGPGTGGPRTAHGPRR